MWKRSRAAGTLVALGRPQVKEMHGIPIPFITQLRLHLLLEVDRGRSHGSTLGRARSVVSFFVTGYIIVGLEGPRLYILHLDAKTICCVAHLVFVVAFSEAIRQLVPDVSHVEARVCVQISTLMQRNVALTVVAGVGVSASQKCTGTLVAQLAR